jgi:hypothetical protein
MSSPLVQLGGDPTPARGGRSPRPDRCRTASAAASSTFASPSPTSATSGASTACRRRGCPGCGASSCSASRRSPDRPGDGAAGAAEGPAHRRRAARPPRPSGARAHAPRDPRHRGHLALHQRRAAGRARRGAPRRRRDRINLSLDSLVPERIDALARRPGSAERIFEGLAAAERVGFAPLKINCVVMRGRNDDEIASFAAATRERPWHVRFIEVMPTGDNLGISRRRIRAGLRDPRACRAIGEIRPRTGPGGNGPATVLRLPDARGTVGVITPMSHNYCDRCNRMRLTADGAAPSLPLRLDRDTAARPAPRRRPARAAHPRDAAHQARATLAGAGQRCGKRGVEGAVAGGWVRTRLRIELN